MYKILLVDDEPVELQFLRYVIEKYKLPLNICAEAKNGLQAVEFADKFKPDFAIIDISMPYMNGLDAAEIIKKKYPWMKIYILTAYEEFDYAKKAISIDVEDYLTKPIRPETLRDILKKTIKLKLKEKINVSKYARQVNFLSSLKPSIKQQLIVDLLFGVEQIERKNAAKILLGIKKFCYKQLIVAMIFDRKNNTLIKDKTILKRIAYEIDCLIGNGLYTVFPNGKIIIFSITKLSTNVNYKINEIFADKFDISAGVCQLTDLKKTKPVFDEANKVCMTAVFWHKIGFFTIDEVTEKKCLIPSLVGFQDNVFSKLLEKGPEQVIEIINKLLIKMGETWYSPEKTLIYIADLLNLIICISSKDIVSNEEITNLRDGISGIYKVECVSDLKNRLNNVINKLGSYLVPEKQSSPEHYVNWTIEYIKQYYKTDISLEKIAGKLFISPFYLSRIFKKQTGFGFTEFLIKTRIERANELLKTGKFSVGEVARLVGINDPSYFSSTFKKYMHVCPSDLIRGQ